MSTPNDDADFIDYTRTAKQTAIEPVRARSAVPVAARAQTLVDCHANADRRVRLRIPVLLIPSENGFIPSHDRFPRADSCARALLPCAQEAEPAQMPPPADAVAALVARAKSMFTGSPPGSGPCASGQRSVASEVADGLLYDAAAAVQKLMQTCTRKGRKLCGPACLVHVQCLVLDKEEMLGYLLADAFGLPLIPEEYARSVGEAARLRAKAVTPAIESAARQAKAAGGGEAAKLLSSLRSRVVVGLPLPSKHRCFDAKRKRAAEAEADASGSDGDAGEQDDSSPPTPLYESEYCKLAHQLDTARAALDIATLRRDRATRDWADLQDRCDQANRRLDEWYGGDEVRDDLISVAETLDAACSAAEAQADDALDAETRAYEDWKKASEVLARGMQRMLDGVHAVTAAQGVSDVDGIRWHELPASLAWLHEWVHAPMQEWIPPDRTPLMVSRLPVA
jgi:hypothetical protein